MDDEQLAAAQLQWYVALHTVKYFNELELDILQGTIDRLADQNDPEIQERIEQLRQQRADVQAAHELIVLTPMRDLQATLSEKMPDLEQRARRGMAQFN